MGNENKKKEPWRLIVGGISLAYILFMWIKKDIVAIYTTMPADQIAPLIATTVVVSLLKVAAIAGVVLLIKWIVGRIQKKNT